MLKFGLFSYDDEGVWILENLSCHNVPLLRKGRGAQHVETAGTSLNLVVITVCSIVLATLIMSRAWRSLFVCVMQLYSNTFDKVFLGM